LYVTWKVVVHGLKQGLDVDHHLPFMIFLTQIVWRKLVFQTISNHVVFFEWEELEPRRTV